MANRIARALAFNGMLLVPLIAAGQGATEDLDDTPSYTGGCPTGGIGSIAVEIITEDFSVPSWTEEIMWHPLGAYDFDMGLYHVYARKPGDSLWTKLGYVPSDGSSSDYSFNLSNTDPRYTDFHLLSVNSNGGKCIANLHGSPYAPLERKKLIHNAFYLAPNEPTPGTVHFQITPSPEIEAITLSYYSDSAGWIIEVSNDQFLLDFDGSLESISFSHQGSLLGDQYEDPYYYGIDVFDDQWNYLDRYLVPRIEP